MPLLPSVVFCVHTVSLQVAMSSNYHKNCEGHTESCIELPSTSHKTSTHYSKCSAVVSMLPSPLSIQKEVQEKVDQWGYG